MEETTWSNNCTSTQPLMTLEEMMTAAAELKERMKTVVTRLEVANEGVRQWLLSGLRKADPISVPLMALGGLDIEINPMLTPNAILAKNRDGKTLFLIIRRADGKLLMLDMKLSDKWMDFTRTK